MSSAPINIKLRCASWKQLASIYRRDLSRHAVFLRSARPPPIGTPVRIDLTLPTESMIVLTGVITTHVPTGGLDGRGPGIDIKLNTIPQSALWLIETALASAGRQEESRVGPTPGAPTVEEAGEESASSDEGADLAEAEQELLTALTSELDSLRRLNPFQVLGVGYEAGDDDVRAAFAELTKRYHPDRFTRYTSTDLRGLAAEIFIVIRDAYRKLGDPPSRAKVLASVGQRPAVQVPSLKPPPTSVAVPPSRGQVARTAPAAVPPAERVPPTPIRPLDTPRRPITVSPPPLSGEDSPRTDFQGAEALLDAGRYDEALAIFKIYARKNPSDRQARAGIEVSEGLKALAQRDRMEAAQRFEAVLEIDPTNERAARELAEMRRLATNERKGLLSRLMGKKE